MRYRHSRAIDAAIQLRVENNLKPGDIAAVELIANPLVLSLTGKDNPRTGLEGKFSIYHCVAVGLIYGAAGERQFKDAVVRDPVVIALRCSGRCIPIRKWARRNAPWW